MTHSLVPASARAEVLPPNDLPTLAVDIRDAVEQADASIRDAVAHAIRAGDLLIEAKAKAGHGNFGRWCADNLPFTARTAQMYMRLADNREEAKRFAHLGISGCLRMLAEQKGIAKKAAAVEAQLAELGPPATEQLTLRDLDVVPEVGRMVVNWLEALPAPVDDRYADDWRRDREHEAIRLAEHYLQQAKRFRAAREQGG